MYFQMSEYQHCFIFPPSLSKLLRSIPEDLVLQFLKYNTLHLTRKEYCELTMTLMPQLTLNRFIYLLSDSIYYGGTVFEKNM